MTTVVQTTAGRVQGVEREGHHAFLGIPFAAPPVGALRFRKPQPVAAWAGVREATRFAPSAMQGKKHSIPGFAATGEISEDCLYLNVYTPQADGRKRPVLVWIHGGGFGYGSGSEEFYDGKWLARRGDAVVVTIHYRLGVLGFAYFGEHGGAQWGADENVGSFDQIAALQWVKDNIESFGGDPGRVTVFGESAGAVSVAVLLAMPAARGLFQRAICQSGTANRLSNTKGSAMLTGALLKQLGLGAGQAEKMRELPVDAIIAAQLAPGGGLFHPVWGAESMPLRGVAALRAGMARDVEVIVGTNRDEQKLFTAVPGRRQIEDVDLHKAVRASIPRAAAGRADEVIALYRSSRKTRGLPTSNNDILDAVSTDSRFRMSAIRMAAAQRMHQPNTFLYLFTQESPARRGSLGSAHALEIPFIFGTLDDPMTMKFTGEGPEVTRLSEDMMDAWLAFAHTGNPSHPRIGQWSRYDDARQNTMVFGPQGGLVDAPFAEELTLWNSMLGAAKDE
jgi:para-nitrobenzyl esterase